MAALSVTDRRQQSMGRSPSEDWAEDPSIVSLGPVIAFVISFPLRRGDLGTRYAPILWCKENFGSVRIFYRGSRRKTNDLDITGLWCKRTGN